MIVRLSAAVLILSSATIFGQAPDPCATAPATCATLIATHATSQTRIPNTVVDVAVGVESSGKDLVEVQRNLAVKSNSLLAYLRKQQVDRLITSRISFSPETRYEKSGPNKTVGYGGSAQVSFRSTPDKVADILAGVLDNGANAIQSTNFTPTEEEMAAARRKLSADATQIAMSQANAIAKAAGIRVVAIRNITVDNNGSQASPLRAGAIAVNGFSGGQLSSIPVDTASGEQQLSIRVDVVAAATH